MARKRTRVPLDVCLNGRLVGRLRREADELKSTGATAIDKTISFLPDGFPAQVADSMASAAKHRLILLDTSKDG